MQVYFKVGKWDPIFVGLVTGYSNIIFLCSVRWVIVCPFCLFFFSPLHWLIAVFKLFFCVLENQLFSTYIQFAAF